MKNHIPEGEEGGKFDWFEEERRILE